MLRILGPRTSPLRLLGLAAIATLMLTGAAARRAEAMTPINPTALPPGRLDLLRSAPHLPLASLAPSVPLLVSAVEMKRAPRRRPLFIRWPQLQDATQRHSLTSTK